ATVAPAPAGRPTATARTPREATPPTPADRGPSPAGLAGRAREPGRYEDRPGSERRGDRPHPPPGVTIRHGRLAGARSGGVRRADHPGFIIKWSARRTPPDQDTPTRRTR